MREFLGEVMESMKQNEMRVQQTFDKLLKRILSDDPIKRGNSV